ncbi:MAG: NAD kinase [Actinomycetaceae bacterium]|nr:NAD kinase [Actinomycetaceae bacterium]MDY6083248.1 NAD kinase [Actinomycetaceae bacterium]
MARKIALVMHRGSHDVAESARYARVSLEKAGFLVDVSESDQAAQGAELILVIGGDGTVLRAAEMSRPWEVPILGINYGHVGFLSEADPEDLQGVIERIVAHDWSFEKRMTIDIEVHYPDGTQVKNWALNEASIEKDEDVRLFEAAIGVDDREISTFKVDNVLFSTATGSTAYNFSAGGPIVWPNVEALLLTPIAAHALFTKPLVVGPDSTLELHVYDGNARIWCDGRREVKTPAGSTVTAIKGKHPIYLARLNSQPFSQRLITKFQLPVTGWRHDRLS